MSNVLTEEHIRNAFRKLNEASKAEEETREQRRLKDRSKLKDFYEVLTEKKATMDSMELAVFAQTIEKLAEGYFLVMPQALKGMTDKELKEVWRLPQEILNNIYVNKFINPKQ